MKYLKVFFSAVVILIVILILYFTSLKQEEQNNVKEFVPEPASEPIPFYPSDGKE
jgi:uncharacterized alpha/beta hydrolase family protein